ncbi:MAG: sulfotransferase [Planctomycetia bacterium]|nr:sulfotransferase [Planctomycetia bacterium]
MSWKYAFIERFGPGGLSGATFGQWCELLWQNRFAVDMKYWPRAAFITAGSIGNSCWRRWELFRFGRKIQHTQVPPPVFVLGIWRSGTTHLHNLLSKDDRFAYPNSYEVLFPHTFLCTESWCARSFQSFTPATRPMDNVKNGVDEPQEDEFALVASGLSFMLGMLVFPRSGKSYHRFLSLQDATPVEVERWKSSLMWFLRKLTLKHGRPLILKSPGHTGRIKFLLEMFPDAKFVHIHRDPYAVFQSTEHTWRKVKAWWALQKDEPDADSIIRDYVEVFDAYFEQRRLISDGNWCEVAFAELERDPMGQLRRIYDQLNLPDFGYVEPKLRDYVESIGGYSKNSFPELPEEMRARLGREWSRCFEEWGYEK